MTHLLTPEGVPLCSNASLDDWMLAGMQGDQSLHMSRHRLILYDAPDCANGMTACWLPAAQLVAMGVIFMPSAAASTASLQEECMSSQAQKMSCNGSSDSLDHSSDVECHVIPVSLST